MSADFLRVLEQPKDWTEFMELMHIGCNEHIAGHAECEITNMDVVKPEDFQQLTKFMAFCGPKQRPSLSHDNTKDYSLSAAVQWVQKTPVNTVVIYGTANSYNLSHTYDMEHIFTGLRRFLREDFHDRSQEGTELPKCYFCGFWQGLRTKLYAGTSLAILYRLMEADVLPDSILRTKFDKLFN